MRNISLHLPHSLPAIDHPANQDRGQDLSVSNQIFICSPLCGGVWQLFNNAQQSTWPFRIKNETHCIQIKFWAQHAGGSCTERGWKASALSLDWVAQRWNLCPVWQELPPSTQISFQFLWPSCSQAAVGQILFMSIGAPLDRFSHVPYIWHPSYRNN